MILNFLELINGFVRIISLDKEHIQQGTTQATLSLGNNSQLQMEETNSGGVDNVEEAGMVIIK